mgnify:CR=1 FL=1
MRWVARHCTRDETCSTARPSPRLQRGAGPESRSMAPDHERNLRRKAQGKRARQCGMPSREREERHGSASRGAVQTPVNNSQWKRPPLSHPSAPTTERAAPLLSRGLSYMTISRLQCSSVSCVGHSRSWPPSADVGCAQTPRGTCKIGDGDRVICDDPPGTR